MGYSPAAFFTISQEFDFIQRKRLFMKKGIFTVALWVLMSVSVAAAPSLQGSTGLINTQSADVLQAGQLTLGFDRLREGSAQNIVMGIAPQLEMGATRIHYNAGVGDKMLFNAKYALLPEQVITPGISIGVEDALNQNKRTDYIAVSKTLPFGFRLHAGAGNGRYSGAFAGIEKTISPGSFLTGPNIFPATTLIAEYDGNAMNYGIRLAIIPGLKIEGGVRSHAAYYGINFTI